MSQTLTVFPALSSPVKITDGATLSANLSAIDDLDNRMVIAMSVIALIYELHSKGGTDYRTNHKQLKIDTSALMNAIPAPGNLEISRWNRIQAVIEWNTAFGLDATLTTNVNTIIVTMAGQRETPEYTLMQEYFFLRYKLSLLGI